MKHFQKNLTTAVILVAMATTFFGCDSDDDINTANISNKLASAFDAKFRDVKPISWERNGNFYVADFYANNSSYNEAWFSPDGTWYMTESDILFDALPEAIKIAFKAGKYRDWRVDDVDKLDRNGYETIYVIEVESGNQDVDLYYSEDGILIKELLEGGSNSYQNEIPEQKTGGILTISEKINAMFEGARILEIENEKGYIEVGIIHQNRKKDVLFSQSGEWVSTKYDVMYNEIPHTVVNAWKTSQYAIWVLDDNEAEYFESTTTKYYELELENGKREIKLHISPDGNIL